MTDSPTLYKATVHIRWRNRATAMWSDVFGGQVVEFDEFDFADPADLDDPVSRPAFTCLESLEAVLASGAFVAFDPATARDVSLMSRDEMIEILVAAGRADGLGMQHPIEALRPLVESLFAEQDAAAAAATRATQEAAAVARLEGRE